MIRIDYRWHEAVRDKGASRIHSVMEDEASKKLFYRNIVRIGERR